MSYFTLIYFKTTGNPLVKQSFSCFAEFENLGHVLHCASVYKILESSQSLIASPLSHLCHLSLVTQSSIIILLDKLHTRLSKQSSIHNTWINFGKKTFISLATLTAQYQ